MICKLKTYRYSNALKATSRIYKTNMQNTFLRVMGSSGRDPRRKYIKKQVQFRFPLATKDRIQNVSIIKKKLIESWAELSVYSRKQRFFYKHHLIASLPKTQVCGHL